MRNQGAKIQTSDGKTYSLLSLPILMPEIGSPFLCLVTGSCFHGNCCSPTLSPLPHPSGQRLPFLLPNSPSPLPPTPSSSTEESSLASSGQEDTAGGREPAYATGRTCEPDAGGREAWESGREKEQVSL